jgi:OOP family OmpA-OmpF porin
MTGKMFKTILFLVVALMVMGCAAQRPAIKAQDLNSKLADAQLVQKVDNFLVILDGTQSMSDPYKGFQSKSEFAKGLVYLMNETIPDLKLMSGLRTFGNVSCWTDLTTALLYGMTSYTKAGLSEAVNKVRTSGNSPLELAIVWASEDLKSTSGDIAIIIFSDGEDMTNAPILAARGMKALYGDRVCIYTVLTGRSPAGQKLLENVAQEGGCGFFVTGDSIASSGGMADFVEKVFLKRKAAEAVRPPAPKPVAAPPAPPEEVKEAKVERQAAGRQKNRRVEAVFEIR